MIEQLNAITIYVANQHSKVIQATINEVRTLLRKEPYGRPMQKRSVQP